VSGCPYKPRYDYLALLAVGSLVGKAQEVDMAFTRQNSQVRMRVLVTDPKYIPKGLSIMCLMVWVMVFASGLRVKAMQKREMYPCKKRAVVMIWRHPPSIPRMHCSKTQLTMTLILQIILRDWLTVVARIALMEESKWLLNLRVFEWV
jgi:hypothetical protein